MVATQWFRPAKYIRGGIRIASWQGAVVTSVYGMVIFGVINLPLSPLPRLLIGVVSTIIFEIIVRKNGGRPNYTIIN
jgi:hypothetical protein